MVNTIKVVAFDAKGFAAAARQRELAYLQGGSGYQIINGFVDAADLATKIRALSTAQNNACVDYLEIDAHGSPTLVDSLDTRNVAVWGVALKTVPWCDTAQIYLAGCNTGLKTAAGAGSIAEALAGAIPFDATAFPYQIRVFGSKGYLRGVNAKGDHFCTEILFTRRWRLKWFLGFIPYPGYDDTVTHTAYPGSVDASGAACWNSFKNGTW